MALPAQIAILQRFWQAPWLPGTFVLKDRYELVTIDDGEVSPPLWHVTRSRGVGWAQSFRSFFRRSYLLTPAAGETYRLVNSSTMLRPRWQLRSPVGEMLGTVTSGFLRPGYRVLVEAATGELSGRCFRARAAIADVTNRFGFPVARIERFSVVVPDRGVVRYRIELEDSSADRSGLRLLVVAGVIAKLKLEKRP